jgi:glutamate-ammonia-ligase adenylyltransferase
MTRTTTTLTELARLGFADLSGAGAGLADVPADLVPLFAAAADPDQALRQLRGLLESAPDAVAPVLADESAARRLVRVLGASSGLADFLSHRPEQLHVLREPLRALPSADSYLALLLDAVEGVGGEAGWNSLRIAYRRELTRLAAWDLEQPDGQLVVDRVAAALADLAAAALDAALALARRASRFPKEEVAATRLAIIGMGKAGARELNYLSDVDVIFVAGVDAASTPGDGDSGDGDGETLSEGRAVEIATRLAMDTMRAIQELAVEPPLWEVDTNLRPEGKDGALVRSLGSHLAYYERWAKSWEFQALLKARAMAGDRELGERYVAGVAPMVWSSASRENFVESVQGMRERVTASSAATIASCACWSTASSSPDCAARTSCRAIRTPCARSPAPRAWRPPPTGSLRPGSASSRPCARCTSGCSTVRCFRRWRLYRTTATRSPASRRRPGSRPSASTTLVGRFITSPP